MKLILLQDVKNIGKKNDIVEVSDGYAVNYLIPRSLAVKFTNKSSEILNNQKQERLQELEKEKQQAIAYQKQLETITLEFKCKASPDGRMCGSISYKQIEQELKSKFNIEIDKRKFIEKFAVNAFGFTRLKIELFKDVIGIVNVHVSEDK